MCGIAGIYDPDLTRQNAENILGKMLGTIRHRGPDSSASWVDMPLLLGHNRLRIIDLNDDADQPRIFVQLSPINFRYHRR